MNLLVVFAYTAGSIVCHQLSERSFFWGDRQFPVCARCTGLYLAAVAAVLCWWAVKAVRAWRPQALPPPMALRLIALASLPTLVSLLFGSIGVWDGSNLVRAMLAVPLGAAAGTAVAAVSTKDLR